MSSKKFTIKMLQSKRRNQIAAIKLPVDQGNQNGAIKLT